MYGQSSCNQLQRAEDNNIVQQQNNQFNQQQAASSSQMKPFQRPLKCPFCNYRFKYEAVLDSHISLRHRVLMKELSKEEQIALLVDYLKADPHLRFPEFFKAKIAKSKSKIKKRSPTRPAPTK